MDTKVQRFCHGTDARAALAILADGSRDPFGPLRAQEFVRELWPIILRATGSFPQIANLFVRAGSEFYASAPVALQNVHDSNSRSTFSYGEFYVSIGLKKAAGYAMRIEDGSKVISRP